MIGSINCVNALGQSFGPILSECIIIVEGTLDVTHGILCNSAYIHAIVFTQPTT